MGEGQYSAQVMRTVYSRLRKWSSVPECGCVANSVISGESCEVCRFTWCVQTQVRRGSASGFCTWHQCHVRCLNPVIFVDPCVFVCVHMYSMQVEAMYECQYRDMCVCAHMHTVSVGVTRRPVYVSPSGSW